MSKEELPSALLSDSRIYLQAMSASGPVVLSFIRPDKRARSYSANITVAATWSTKDAAEKSETAILKVSVEISEASSEKQSVEDTALLEWLKQPSSSGHSEDKEDVAVDNRSRGKSLRGTSE